VVGKTTDRVTGKVGRYADQEQFLKAPHNILDNLQNLKQSVSTDIPFFAFPRRTILSFIFKEVPDMSF
jgi:hypothetical protein